jgi:hypothetical protein
VTQSIGHAFQHTGTICKDIIVPEAQDNKALLTQPFVTNLIMPHGSRTVLATINLDDQSSLEADKVNNVSANRELSSERDALKSMCPEL